MHQTLRHAIMLLEQIRKVCASVTHKMLSNVLFMCKTAFHLLQKGWSHIEVHHCLLNRYFKQQIVSQKLLCNVEFIM